VPSATPGWLAGSAGTAPVGGLGMLGAAPVGGFTPDAGGLGRVGRMPGCAAATSVAVRVPLVTVPTAMTSMPVVRPDGEPCVTEMNVVCPFVLTVTFLVVGVVGAAGAAPGVLGFGGSAGAVTVKLPLPVSTDAIVPPVPRIM